MDRKTLALVIFGTIVVLVGTYLGLGFAKWPKVIMKCTDASGCQVQDASGNATPAACDASGAFIVQECKPWWGGWPFGSSTVHVPCDCSAANASGGTSTASGGGTSTASGSGTVTWTNKYNCCDGSGQKVVQDGSGNTKTIPCSADERKALPACCTITVQVAPNLPGPFSGKTSVSQKDWCANSTVKGSQATYTQTPIAGYPAANCPAGTKSGVIC